MKAFMDGNFLHYLKNSVLIDTLAVALIIIISIMAAFACLRMKWKLGGFVSTLLVLGMMIPIHATLLPNYKIYNTLHLTDTIWALLIPYVAFSLPQGMFLMTGFLQSVPKELEEAAVKFDADDYLKNAQKYAHDMIGNMNHGMNAFYDWNIVLDELGGPNHVGNFCDAPFLYDTKKKELYIWH